MEDNKADVFLVREALQAHGVAAALRVVEDGEQAIQFIQGLEADDSAPCPSLFLLDLNLPKKSGRDVLVHLRSSRKCGQVPVLVLTSSDSVDDREEMKKLGAQRYFRKPSGYEAFIKIGEIIQELLPKQKLQ